MQRSIKTQIWIYLCILIRNQTVAVPVEYDIMETDREISFDFDTEQSQARYDPRLLSEELRDIHSLLQERAESCFTLSVRYEHGEKVARSDPCEMCLCVDGEMFCWWKKCDHIKQKKKMLKNSMQNSRNLGKLSVERKKNQTKSKKMKLIPKKILSFPRHLPATLHYELATIENTETTHGEDKVSLDELSSALLDVEQWRNRERSARRPFAINGGDVNHEHNNNYAETVPTKGHEKKIKYPHNADIPINLYPNIYEEAKTNLGGVFKLKHSEMNELNNYESSTEIKRNGFQQLVLNSNKTFSTTSRKDNSSTNHKNTGINEENDTGDVNDDDNGIQIQLSDRYQNEKIQFVDVPLAKHYIITSSGSVENDDILVSDNVLSQFRSGYSIVNGDTMANILLADGIDSDALQKKTSTSTNRVVDPALMGTLDSLSTVLSEAPVAETNPTVTVTATVSPKSSSFISTASHQSPLSPLSLSPPLFLSKQRSGLSTPQADTTQEPPQRQCIVMGKSYEIGTVLPQDTGNCLQCICINGANVGDPPRVTCSPHNCPPLVLPDLFDTTGY